MGNNKLEKAENKRVISKNEFLMLGEQLYGGGQRHWKFRCPSCSEVQTFQDFIDGGVSSEVAMNRFYFSCIGRLIPGRGCDWSLGGLFAIHTVEVVSDGEIIPVMEFADGLEQRNNK